MQWINSSNREWLETRKCYLSNSDVKDLLAVAPNGRKRMASTRKKAALRIWGEKQTPVSEENVISKGIMARGHIMEPYAIDAFNRSISLNNLPFALPLHHWDDKLIIEPTQRLSSFSPDALCVPMPPGNDVVAELSADCAFMGEIKSYDGPHHYEAAFADAMKLDERWQVAMAMYCHPHIEAGCLILFNPAVQNPLFIQTYFRSFMDDELKAIQEAIDFYYDYADELERTAQALRLNVPVPSEQEIWDDWSNKLDI